MKLTDKWSSLTFFNEDEEHPQKISIKLSGIEGRGGAGLQPDKQYYIYDFWNDKLIGTFGGNETLEQELRKGEARQMASFVYRQTFTARTPGIVRSFLE